LLIMVIGWVLKLKGLAGSVLCPLFFILSEQRFSCALWLTESTFWVWNTFSNYRQSLCHATRGKEIMACLASTNWTYVQESRMLETISKTKNRLCSGTYRKSWMKPNFHTTCEDTNANIRKWRSKARMDHLVSLVLEPNESYPHDPAPPTSHTLVETPSPSATRRNHTPPASFCSWPCAVPPGVGLLWLPAHPPRQRRRTTCGATWQASTRRFQTQQQPPRHHSTSACAQHLLYS
jgi:hypothetical protein